MYFFNAALNPLLAFLGGEMGHVHGPMGPSSPWRPGMQEMLSMQMQQRQVQLSAQQQKDLMNAQAMFNPTYTGAYGPVPKVVRSNAIVQHKSVEELERLRQTPFSGERTPAKVALEQFKPAEKDVTPDPEFECAQCGHPGPKDRLRGCQVCGGMVWK